MGLPKPKNKIERVFFQMRIQEKYADWLRKMASERLMFLGEFCEAIFEDLMEKERCAKKKRNSTPKSNGS